jgi:hypothetical protein
VSVGIAGFATGVGNMATSLGGNSEETLCQVCSTLG